MTNNNRDNFTAKTISIIGSRVGYKCCFPGCNKQTTGPHTNSGKKVSIGEAAHICAAAPGGARYDSSMTEEQRKSPDNGIWMCCTHAHLIDTDPSKYPTELLRMWKSQAEYTQHCLINGMNNVTLNNPRYNEALRILNKDINDIHSMYSYFNEYYNSNFSMCCNNFIDVNNQIEKYWNLHGTDLNNNTKILNESIATFLEDYSKYQLDIDTTLDKKLNEYMGLSNFVYNHDGDVGCYNNYYEKFFEMVYNKYSQMQVLITQIDSIIREDYNRI